MPSDPVRLVGKLASSLSEIASPTVSANLLSTVVAFSGVESGRDSDPISAGKSYTPRAVFVGTISSMHLGKSLVAGLRAD
jgi:hypothetical protein